MTEKQIEAVFEILFAVITVWILLTWCTFIFSHKRMPADAFEVWGWICNLTWGAS